METRYYKRVTSSECVYYSSLNSDKTGIDLMFGPDGSVFRITRNVYVVIEEGFEECSEEEFSSSFEKAMFQVSSFLPIAA